MNNCTFPWTGILIEPQGYITLCCNMWSRNRIFNKHISEIDSLIDFFNGKEYNDIRKEFDEKTYINIPECFKCREDKALDRWAVVDKSQEYDPHINKIQFLEFTTSNVCNQSCVMCSSQYSNQWLKINSLFDRPYDDKTYILTDKDINKICECLTDLKELQIKGGEPFADIRNYKILKKLFEVNDECIVRIITNGSLIPEKYMDLIFKNPKRFIISSSIDAIGKRYEWIRSTSWEKTDNTLKELYYQTGVKSQVNPVVSAYNLSAMTSLNNWAINAEYIGGSHESFNELSKFYNKYNEVNFPSWACARKVFTQEQIDTITDLPWPIISEYNDNAYNDYVKYTQVMNKVRGFDIDIWNDMG